ncbi:hypothetical protein [Streptomyces sp. NPDC005732]|uniref:hypothetical protein n=1 Tax=Streptomyces sp. NPDC005732 TaxID=3157057 RepID=UPI00340DE6B7
MKTILAEEHVDLVEFERCQARPDAGDHDDRAVRRARFSTSRGERMGQAPPECWAGVPPNPEPAPPFVLSTLVRW